jgi:hypothetical protein
MQFNEPFEAPLVKLDEKNLYGTVRVLSEHRRVILVHRPGAMPKVGEYIKVAEPGNTDESIQAFLMPPTHLH